MLRYTLLRLLVFFGMMCALYLVGMRGILLLVISALASAILSVFLLAGPREQFAQQIDEKVQARRARAEEHRSYEDDDEE